MGILKLETQDSGMAWVPINEYISLTEFRKNTIAGNVVVTLYDFRSSNEIVSYMTNESAVLDLVNQLKEAESNLSSTMIKKSNLEIDKKELSAHLQFLKADFNSMTIWGFIKKRYFKK